MHTTVHSTTQGDLFFDAVVADAVGHPRFLRRNWLADTVAGALDAPDCRFLWLTAEPGFGLSTLVAHLRHANPTWPVYFIRRDQRTPLGDIGPHSFLLHLGYQLAALYPELFDPQRVKIDIEQTVGEVTDGGQVVGIRAERLLASPFYEKALQIRQTVERNAGQVTGLSVGEYVVDARLIALSDLQYMALFDPAQALWKQDPAARIVVLVDALDELRYRSTQETLLSWLTHVPEMPANVRFVLTGRPPETALRLFREKQGPFLAEIELDPADPRVEADLRAYAKRLAARPAVAAALAEAGHSEAAFTAAAVGKADGNLGYLDALTRGIDRALAEDDAEALATLLALKRVPEGLDNLNAFFLHQVRAGVETLSVEVEDPTTGTLHYVREWYALYKKLLGVLAVAREPLTLTQLQTLGRIAAMPGHQADAVGRLRQFLNQLGDHYRLYHASVPAFLTAPDTHARIETADLYVDPVRWHRRLADYYWPEDAHDWSGCDAYGLNNLATHLYECVDHARLHALISEAWMRRRYEAGGQTYEGFLDDVEIARQAATDADDLMAMVRLAMARQVVTHQVHSYTDTDLRTMVWMGRRQEAVSHARLRNTADTRHAGLQAICEALLRRGEPDEALLREAEDAARALDDARLRAEALAAVAATWAEADAPQPAATLLDEAEQQARAIEQDAARWAALAAVAAARAHAGEPDEAASTAAEVDHDGLRTTLLAAVAAAQAQAGRFDDAEDAARAVPEDRPRALALAVLAAALAPSHPQRAAALFDEAVATARESASTHETLQTDDLLGTTEETALTWLSAQPEGLAAVAVVLAQAGVDAHATEVFDEARQHAFGFGENMVRDAAVAALATALAQAGRTEHARKTASQIPNPLYRARALGALALWLVQGGAVDDAEAAFAEAQEAARQVQPYQPEALAAVAEVLTQTGAAETAETLFQHALALAHAIPEKMARSMALVAVASALARAGRYDNAHKTIHAIADDPPRFLALAALAVTLARDGKATRATLFFTYLKGMARSIEEGPAQSPALAVLAASLTQAERYEDARQVAGTIAVEPVRRAALALAAPRPLSDAALREAEQAARQIEELVPRSIVLADVASALAQTGRFDDAEAAARAIWIPLYQAQAFAAVASALAQTGRFDDALRLLGPLHPNAFVQTIAGWTPYFEQRRPGLARLALQRAIDVACWEMPGWHPVRAMLAGD